MNIPTKAVLLTAMMITASLASPQHAQDAKIATQVATEAQTVLAQPIKVISTLYTPSVAATEAVAQLTGAQVTWLAKLITCESSGNPAAINPKDKDGTKSFGLLQFKPATFYAFAKAYGIQVGNYMDPDEQVEITSRMIQSSATIDWAVQFPACTKKYGTPPV